MSPVTNTAAEVGKLAAFKTPLPLTTNRFEVSAELRTLSAKSVTADPCDCTSNLADGVLPIPKKLPLKRV